MLCCWGCVAGERVHVQGDFLLYCSICTTEVHKFLCFACASMHILHANTSAGNCCTEHPQRSLLRRFFLSYRPDSHPVGKEPTQLSNAAVIKAGRAACPAPHESESQPCRAPARIMQPTIWTSEVKHKLVNRCQVMICQVIISHVGAITRVIYAAGPHGAL
jgi:hypothetical protein